MTSVVRKGYTGGQELAGTDRYSGGGEGHRRFRHPGSLRPSAGVWLTSARKVLAQEGLQPQGSLWFKASKY